MRVSRFTTLALILAVITVTIALIPGCKRVRPLSAIPGHEAEAQEKTVAPSQVEKEAKLIEVATSRRQWTGVAVSREGRIFVNFPRWSDDVPVSVGEILELGEVIPFPNEEWNDWDPSRPPGDHFICVQSVHIVVVKVDLRVGRGPSETKVKLAADARHRRR